MSGREIPGGVSLVVVHTVDEPVDAAWLASVVAAGPPAGTDVVVVDAATAAGGGRPAVDGEAVRIVRSDRFGLAVARNTGAAAAAGDVVAFLAVGAMPSPGWLDAATRVMDEDGSVACVAPTLAGAGPSAVSFDGRAVPAAASSAPGAGDADVLHAPSEAVVVRTPVFLASGGFDEGYGRFGEDVDLGWRLWLLGYRVRRCRASVVDVSAVRPPAVPEPERRYLTERNALSTIYKHYEEPRLAAALPAAMALAAVRAGDDPARQAAAARAVAAFADGVDRLAPVRARLQDARRRTDQEVLRVFGDPAGGDGTSGPTPAAVGRAFGLEAFFGARRRIAVVTADSLTERMAGPAIRAWEVATALSAEHDVRLATTTRCEIGSDRFRVEPAGDAELGELLEWCDVFVMQGWVLHGRSHLRFDAKVLVVDLYDPMHLEQLELARGEGDAVRRGTVRQATAALNDQLARGDYFVCASTKQRDFWLGQLAGLGRVNPLTYDESETLETLIDIVPFGVRDEPPVHDRPALKGVVDGIGPDDEVILWGGGIYNWFDPLTLVRAVDRLRARRPNVRLYFLGLRHPNPEVLEMRMAVETRALADRLGLTGTHVFFNEGWVAYGDRHNYLLEADVGVSTHLDHVETAYSFRTRILDYLWAALPIVATAGDAFAEMIERESLGLTVPAGDVEALEEALFRVLDDAEFSSMCRKNAAAVRHRFAWSEVLVPLVEFCRRPRRAPDLVDPEMAASLGAAAASHPRRPGLRGDAALALAYLRQGGLAMVARKAGSRVGHRLAGRR